MEFWSIIVNLLFIVCLSSGPIIIFMVKPEAPHWQKHLKLLLPIFFAILAIGGTLSFPECFNHENNGCWRYKSYFLIFITLQYITGLGWCELAWRERYKQLAWPLHKNLQYGVLSNFIISLSIIVTVIDLCLVTSFVF